MKNTAIAITTMCFLSLSSVSLQAGGPWRLSLGVNYRQVDDVKIDATAFQSPNPGYPDYVNGAVLGMPGGFVFVEDDNRQVNPAGIASLDTITLSSASKGMDGGWGLALGAEKLWRRNDDIAWNLNLSLLTARADMSTRLHGNVSTDAFDVSGVPPPILPSPFSPANPNSAQYGPGVFPVPAGGTATTFGYFDFDVDLDLYTFGAGISGNYAVRKLNLLAGAGPTLNIADYSVKATEVVRWDDDGSVLYSRRRSNDTLQVLFGAYVNVGLRYDFNERVGISAEYRYDHVFDKIRTTLTEIDLRGSSGQLKLSYQF